MPVSHDEMYLLLVTNEPGNPWMPPESLDHLLRERLQSFTAPVVTAIRDQINDPSKVSTVRSKRSSCRRRGIAGGSS